MNITRNRLAAVLAVAALAAPAAQASIPHEPGADPGPPVTSADRQHARLDGSLPPASRPIVIGRSAGFDWTDAGIGFGVALGLALLGAGTIATVHWRRDFGRPAH